MCNIILFSIDISLNNLLTLLGLHSVYEILDLRNIMVVGDMAKSTPLFSRNHFFLELKIGTHTRSLLYTLSLCPFFSSVTYFEMLD